jgi:hypothetical protein
MKAVKLISVLKFLTVLMIFGVIGCQQSPSNNWSEDDKANVAGSIKYVIQNSGIQTLVNDQNVIAEKVLNKCLTKYPNIEDFKKNTGYSGEAFREIMHNDYNLN